MVAEKRYNLLWRDDIAEEASEALIQRICHEYQDVKHAKPLVKTYMEQACDNFGDVNPTLDQLTQDFKSENQFYLMLTVGNVIFEVFQSWFIRLYFYRQRQGQFSLVKNFVAVLYVLKMSHFNISFTTVKESTQPTIT